MPTLIFRTSGRKIKRPQPTTSEKIYNLLIQTGSTPREAANRLKYINLTNQNRQQ